MLELTWQNLAYPMVKEVLWDMEGNIDLQYATYRLYLDLMHSEYEEAIWDLAYDHF